HAADVDEVDAIGRLPFLKNRLALLIAAHAAQRSKRIAVIFLERGEKGNRVERDGHFDRHTAESIWSGGCARRRIEVGNRMTEVMAPSLAQPQTATHGYEHEIDRRTRIGSPTRNRGAGEMENRLLLPRTAFRRRSLQGRRRHG